VAVPDCVDAAFADLVYADDNWVRDEFDAIIAESFDEPPQHNPRPQRWWRPRQPAHQRFPCDGGPSWPTASGSADMVGGNVLHRAEVLEAHQKSLQLKAAATEPACCSGFDRAATTAGPRGGPASWSRDVYADCPAET
jgi:hypothetical protein